MNYILLFEDYNTGVFKVNINGEELILRLYIEEEPITRVYLILNNEIYEHLSVEIPESKYLNKGEFFLNPEISNNIVEVLINQQFIEETGKKAQAGLKETISYQLV